MRTFLAVVAGLVVVGASVAAPPRTKLGMMVAVKAGLLTVETARAAKLAGSPAVACSIAVSRVPIVQCFAMSGGRVVDAVAAHYVCGATGQSSCAARPVCTYEVSVAVGARASDRVVSVCRRNWVRLVG